ncbi:MAG: DUF5916 domain-containing protein [Ekhidna sp.]|uniref:DUF5916 domain-containing protein n=1 Tax=Ekhidna sp. TaxID=2608089 RepID=UPI0032EF9A0C
MRLKLLTQFVTLLCLCTKILGQEELPPKKSYTTDWIKSEITIDGKLDEEAWDQVEWGGDFIGHRPAYNVEPKQQTQFKILYDAKFLYVGVRAFDTEPDKIVKRMSRRDGFDGDFVEINIDSYGDKRTAFSFSASVSGVKGDEYVSNNGDNWDSTWDPIWYLRTSVDDQGWIAEFKIPLSQLRFANKENHTWGIQFTRRIFREEERSTWQPVDPNAPGWVHLFGELNGIKGIKPQKQLEIQPYVLSSLEKYPKEEGNPFRDAGKEFKNNVGVDAKIGITSDITLDLTVNPDFGQVEGDPSQVNLSAFEIFFQERRPFFLEGSNILDFGTSGGINNLFYSRRIGRSPQGQLPDDVEYADVPRQTRLIGAAKLTGKNAKGFSWGVLESVTNSENAEVMDTLRNFRSETIEPMTNYFAARFQQDLNNAKTVFGAIVTNVNRFDNQGNGMELLHDNAQSGGFDIDHNFKDRKYGVNFKYGFSRVTGSRGSIYRTQNAFQRSFQRTDNTYKSVDSTRTELVGTFSSFSFGKRSGEWRWTVGSNYKSPELELNDIGFLRQTDIINNWAWTNYRINKVTKLFRNQSYNMYFEQNLDFGGVVLESSMNGNVFLEFKNLWRFETGFFLTDEQVSNADLRGGPSIIYPGGNEIWYWIGTNTQKKVRVSFNQWLFRGNNDYARSSGVSMGLIVRPIDALNISLSPSIQWRRNDLQYVTSEEFDGSNEYLLGRVQQKIYRLTIRANYNITPNLTLEYWGQPFVATAKYDDFKKTVQPNSENFNNRFASLEYSYNNSSNEYSLEGFNSDEPYILGNPNSNVVEYKSNLVLRWEYIPGSTLFVVWANNGFYNNNQNEGSFRSLSNELNDLSSTNTFLIKYTYRFIL